MAADLATLQTRLSEAETAQHRLLTGTGIVTIKDQNGEMVTYQATNAGRLAAYIEWLKQQIAELEGCSRPSGPMRVWM